MSALATGSNRGGLFVSLRGGLNAGLLVGFWSGLVDGVVAGVRTDTSGVGAWLGCLGASIFTYAMLWSAILIPLGLALHVRLAKRPLAKSVAFLAAIGLGLAIAAELYWWSREWLFYGVPALDWRRILVAIGALALGLPLGFVALKLGGRAPRWTKWAVVIAIPIACIGGTVFLITEQQKSDELGALDDRNRDLPNVVLVIVDALRADALGCYGNTRVKTPVIDRLAAEGALFENEFVQAPFTWSSFGSILAAKYVRRHGLVKMAPGVQLPSNVTLPWHLKSAKRLDGVQLEAQDYDTAAFLTGTVTNGSGLARGFDAYFEALVGHQLVEVDNPWSVFRSELLISIFTNKFSQQVNDAPVAKEACEWLERNGHKRFACLVHLYSTHTPYDPPANFRANLCDPKYTGPIHSFYSDSRIAIEEGKYKLSPDDIAQIQNLYYAGAQQADAMIGQVVAELSKLGVLDRTIFVVTGDHGEELNDHGLWEHNWMFQTNLHTPLVMRFPPKLPAKTRVGGLVQSIDILPTICDLAGLEAPGLHTKDPLLEMIDGVSLLPLVRGEVKQSHPYSFAENGLYLSVQDAKFKLFVRPEALTPEGWKAALASTGERPHLYDLALDPKETKNVVAEHPEEAERLIGELRKWNDSMPIRRDAVDLSERDRRDEEQLMKQLGYADGVGSGAGSGHAPRSDPPNPKKK